MLIWILALAIALSVHEYAHARAADELGDPTPRSHGRLTLNPLAHLDPIGTLTLLLFGFGWGKPVPIDRYNLKNPRRDEAIIGVAGSVTNFTVAILLSLIYRGLSQFFPLSTTGPVTTFFSLTVAINLGLGFFNLIPFPPLDGSKVFLGLLPEKSYSEWQDTLQKYGVILLILLFIPLPGTGQSIIDLTLRPAINFMLRILLPSATTFI